MSVEGPSRWSWLPDLRWRFLYAYAFGLTFHACKLAPTEVTATVQRWNGRSGGASRFAYGLHTTMDSASLLEAGSRVCSPGMPGSCRGSEITSLFVLLEGGPCEGHNKEMAGPAASLVCQWLG
jgi:hypothetical protein